MMDRVLICAECGAPLQRVALVDLVISYEEDKEENILFEQAWHKGCYLEYAKRQAEKSEHAEGPE